MKSDARVFVAGHNGLVGSAIRRNLEAAGHTNLLLRTRKEVDLTDQRVVSRFFDEQKPEYVFLAAAKVGGILANSTYPADFIRDNLMVQTNVIDAAWRTGVKKLVFLGSSCIYPREAPQPIREEHFLTGPLEPTNDAYAVAKIAGIKMVQSYHRQHGFQGISLMPTNLYGPGDNFDLASSHVLPALLRKFHDAKATNAATVTIWGTGSPKREFMHVDDLADAAVFLMRNYDSDDIINVGVGVDVTIRELAETIRDVVGWKGDLVFDSTKPDGMPRKLLDVSKLRTLGWKPKVNLREGIGATYSWYLKEHS